MAPMYPRTEIFICPLIVIDCLPITAASTFLACDSYLKVIHTWCVG